MFQSKLSHLIHRLKSKGGIQLPYREGSAAGKTKHLVFGLGVLMSCVVSLIFSRPTQAGNETLTLETYYPAPYGIYNEFTTTGQTVLATEGGYVGIGTTAPGAKLEVNGGVKIGDDRTCNSAKAGTMRYSAAANLMEYCDSSAWTRVNEFTQFQVWDTPASEPGPGYSFVVPDGVSRIMVEMWGAGGGGNRGDRNDNGYMGGVGGGGGAYAKQILNVTSGETWNIKVGSGGSGSGAEATPGANTQIFSVPSSYLQAGGGQAGSTVGPWCQGVRCQGGEVSGTLKGDNGIYINGQSSPLGSGFPDPSRWTTEGGDAGGPGGSGGSYFADSDRPRVKAMADGVAPGGGGGGAWSNSKEGGDGADGRVIIYW